MVRLPTASVTIVRCGRSAVVGDSYWYVVLFRPGPSWATTRAVVGSYTFVMRLPSAWMTAVNRWAASYENCVSEPVKSVTPTRLSLAS